MTVETMDDLAGLRLAGAAVADARDTMASALVRGITTADLDAIGREVLARHGARSGPQLAYDFPGTTCISVNNELAHGIPSGRVIREGDLVNIDVCAELDGYWADTGASYPVGSVTASRRRLLRATSRALADAMPLARAGAPVSRIGRAVERRAAATGFAVVAQLCGHGVGRFVHEPPSVSNVFDPHDRTRLHEGLVITIEPFLSTGAGTVYTAADGWTLKTPDGSVGAQFEHTLIVTRGEPIVLTGATPAAA